jgi:hypothetical protein
MKKKLLLIFFSISIILLCSSFISIRAQENLPRTAGTQIDNIFSDDFEIGSLSSDWSVTGTGGVDSSTANSGIYSAYHCDSPGSVTLKSFDVSDYDSINISYWIRRGADSFSENPEAGEDFVVEYYNNIGSWIEIETFLGSGTPGDSYTRTHTFSAASVLHASFRIRFRQTAGGGGGVIDWWHFDDVEIKGKKTISDNGGNGDGNGNGDGFLPQLNEDQIYAILGVLGLFAFYKIDRTVIKIKKGR